MTDFLSQIDEALQSSEHDSLLDLVKLPLHTKINLTPAERAKRGKSVDFHMRLPQGLMDDLARIAKRYPHSSRNTVIRLFLELAVKGWEEGRAKAADGMKPILERATKRAMGEGRNK